MKRRNISILAVAALAALSACGGSGSGGQGSVPAPARQPASGRPSGRATGTSTTRPVTVVARLTPWTLPEPVSRPVVLARSGHILILGGLATGDVSTAAVVTVDPASGTTGTPGRLEEAVHDAAGALLGDTAFVFGGGSYATLSAVQGWTSGTAQVVGRLPVARSDLAAAVVGGTAYVLGGFDGSHLTGAILATRDGLHFKVVGELPQPVRYPGVAVDGSGRIWVAGGEMGASENADLGGSTDDIQRFDPATGQASVVGHLPHGIGHDQALFLGGQLLITGGRTGTGPSAAIWRLNPDNGSVISAGALPGPRSDAGSVVISGVGYLVGGEVAGPSAPLASVVELRVSGA